MSIELMRTSSFEDIRLTYLPTLDILSLEMSLSELGSNTVHACTITIDEKFRKH